MDDFNALLGRPSHEISESGFYEAIPELQPRYDAIVDFLITLTKRLRDAKLKITNAFDQEVQKETPFSSVVDNLASGQALRSIYDSIKDTLAWKDIAKVLKDRFNLEGIEAFYKFSDGVIAEASRYKFGKDVHSKYDSTTPQSYGGLNYNLGSGMDSNTRNKGTHHGDPMVSLGLSIKAVLEYASKNHDRMPQKYQADIINALLSKSSLQTSYVEALKHIMEGSKIVVQSGTPKKDALALKELGIDLKIVSEQPLLTVNDLDVRFSSPENHGRDIAKEASRSIDGPVAVWKQMTRV